MKLFMYEFAQTKRVMKKILVTLLIPFSLSAEATLIGDEYFVTRHFQLTNGTDQYAPFPILSATASEGQGPEVNDFGSWRLNMHVDVEASSIIISERGYTLGGDGFITSFGTNNNFHYLEITGLDFADPALSIIDASIQATVGNTPVTEEDIIFGEDYVYIEIGGRWDDLSQVIINLEYGVASVPEPSLFALTCIGVLSAVRLKGTKALPVKSR